MKIFVLLFFFFNILIIKCIDVLKSTIHQENPINVLGVEYSYAIGDIELSQDLYYHDSWISCPYFTCSGAQNTTLLNQCTCDYTDKANCPKTIGTNCPQCPNYCQNDVEWITLTELDQLSTYSINQTTQFRYKAKGTTCRGFSLKINSIQGYATIKVGTASPDKSQMRSAFAQRNVMFSSCPLGTFSNAIPALWTMDTYFIEVTPVTDLYNFSLILHDIEIAQNNVQSDGECKQEIISISPTESAAIFCLGINLSTYLGNNLYYKVLIKEAGFYHFVASTLPLYPHLKYFISKSESNKIPSMDNCDWQFIEEGDNDAVIYLEPINETQPLTLYISFLSLESGTYIFGISNVGKRYSQPVSSYPSIQSGYLALKGSSKLVLPNQVSYFTSTINSDPNKISFSPLYPTLTLNAIYPPSKVLISDALSIDLQVPVFNSFKSNSYQFSFLLSKKSYNQYSKYQDFETIQNSTLVLDSTLVDKNGMPIKLNITFSNTSNQDNLECNVEEFNTINQLINQVKDKLLVVNNIQDTTSLRYSLDYLQSTNLWLKCKDKFTSYFGLESSLETKRVKNCPYLISDPEYENDPCCSLVKAYDQCCNPTPINITSIKLTSINSNLVKDQCSSYDCTASVLNEYQKTVSNLDLCTVSDYSLTKIGYSVTSIVRECKDVLNAPFCLSDQDCTNYGASKCNSYNSKCIPDFEKIDKMYIKCVLSQIPIGTLFYLTNSTSFNDTTIDQIYNSHLVTDCVGSLSALDRSTYSYISALDTSNRCSKNDGCMDSTCLLHQDICLDVYSDFKFTLDSRVGTCTDYGFCKSSGCIDCKDECTSTDSFCGYCSDENLTQCHNLKSINDQSQCESQSSICLLADGSIVTGVTEKECTETYGKCSHNNCGDVKCSTIIDGFDSGCFSLTTKDLCLSAGGNFSSNYCRLPVTSDQCVFGVIGGTDASWVECGGKAFGECHSGFIDKLPLVCTEKYSRDCTKEECESIAGECSDSFYFSTDANPNYPNGLGKCVHDHTFVIKSKTCQYHESDSPEGCYTYSPPLAALTESTCLGNEGYKWWTRSVTRDQCLSKMGCKVMIDTNIQSILPYNFKFNEMDRDECESCEESFNQYTNKFTWTNATWLPGIFKKATWIKNQYISNKIQSVFSYQLFYNDIQQSLSYQNSEVFRTESLCRIKFQKPLESLICSCVDDGYQVFNSNSSGQISQCFQSSVPSIGQVKVCAGEESEFTFDYGQIIFDNNAINQTCQTFTIGQISKIIYTSSIRESLASNFVSYKKPPSYAVLNSKDATVGFLSSDGIMIQSQEGINRATLCFKKSTLGEYDSDYPILDIAIQINNQSLPVPLELSNQLINSTDLHYICSVVNEIPKGDPIYFQIYRTKESDWRTKEKELFDKETKVMMYILAIVFLLITVFGLYEIITIIIFYFKKIIVSFQLIQSLIFIVTLFIFIRAIYFFLLVSGKLQNEPVLDYILVVLPTFIYFTAFSSLIILWYTIVFLVLRNNNGARITNKLYTIVISVNLILYVFFICIVLVFQYTNFEPKNDCGSRIFIPNQASKPQKAISLAYAIVQAVLSLIISAAFVYLGRTLYTTINSNKKNSKHQRRIFILSTICSIGFLLHCIFVLVLVTNISSMVFSFIGLIITEIIPVISILYCFNPNDQNNNSNNSNNSSKDGVRTRSGKSKVSKSINTSKLSDMSIASNTSTSMTSINNSPN